MARHYGSFLVRCWQVAADQQRIEIEHVQSGQRTCVPSLADMVRWMEAHWARASADRPSEAAQERSEEGR